MGGGQSECSEVLLKLLFKGKIAAFLLFQYLVRDKVDKRIQLQRRLAPKLQGVTLWKKKKMYARGFETLAQ